jgi:protocatechuate 3,4-dioxygenase beta subunit
MKRDSRPGPVSSRRAALGVIGATGAAWLGARSLAQATRAQVTAPGCVLTPSQTEGPYFVDEKLRRADIRADPSDGSVRPGALLTLELRVSSVGGGRCVPVSGAIVDLWHCDAAGIYSDASDARFGTRGSKFLRGYQVTDAGGHVRFTTIYPGAYPGRTVHIHFKVRTSKPGRVGEFTSQLYFDDALTDRVHAQPPYAGPGARRMRNDGDGLYRAGGRELQLDVVSTAEGYATAYAVGIDA